MIPNLRSKNKKLIKRICCSVSQSCPTLYSPMDCSMPGFPVLYHFLEFAQTHFHWVSDCIQPSHPLSPPSPLALNLSSIKVFSSEWALHIKWLKYWSFSFSISPSNEYSGLIFFGIDWFDLLAVQGTLKSLLQYHSSKASILWRSAFFTSNSHMATGKAISSVQFSSVAQSCLTLRNPMNRSMPGLPIHHQLPESTQPHVHRISDAITALSSSVIPFSSCPESLQSFPASESFPVSLLCTSGGQSYWSLSFSISPSNEYSGLLSFRIVWFDLLAAQLT